jgi:pullulanase/glycogen debranching enzyme
MRERAKLGLTNGWADEADPNAGINYLDIHDNWALADQFALHTEGEHAWDGRYGVDEAGVRLAATLLLTSLGPVVLHGGTEILRSKGSALHPGELPGGQLMLQTSLGPIYYKGRGDTYNVLRPNLFDWEGADVHYDPARRRAMFDWWKGLIALRQSDAGRVFRRGDAAAVGTYRFFEPAETRALGYVVGERVLVLLNSAPEAVTFEGVDLPAGRWRLVADGERIEPARGLRQSLDGGRAHGLAVPARTARIWVREE